jgi:hypothetical protein
VTLMLELQRTGVQMFLATHNYVLLKEIDLQREPIDSVVFHTLYRGDETGEVSCNSTSEFDAITPNPLVDTMLDLYERDVERDFSDAPSTIENKKAG